MDKQLELLPFVQGINPNLAAGQRAYKMELVANRQAGGENPYEGVRVSHNAQFYNFGFGQFTIFIRFLFLGHNYDNGYGSRISLLNKRADSFGYELNLEGLPGKLTMALVAGGGGSGVSDTRNFPIDGFFHSAAATRRTDTPAAGQDVNNILLFVDGVEVTGNNKVAGGVTPNFDNLNSLYVGGLNFSFMRGYIDVAAFYTVGLSDAEIMALSDPATRTDRGAKFILDFNQVSAAAVPGQVNQYTGIDSTSVGQNAVMFINAANAAGRAFVKTDGIRTFRRASTLQPALNGPFTPAQRERVTRISRYDADVTACEYSTDNVLWTAVAFDATGLSSLLNLDIDPNGLNPTLYVRATNANPSFLNAVELYY